MLLMLPRVYHLSRQYQERLKMKISQLQNLIVDMQDERKRHVQNRERLACERQILEQRIAAQLEGLKKVKKAMYKRLLKVHYIDTTCYNSQNKL
jgi:hypothetical protein